MASAPNAFPNSITIDRQTVPVEIVGRANAFPGMTSLRPLVVVDERRLLEAFEGLPNPLAGANASDELWIRGDPAAARACAVRAELRARPDPHGRRGEGHPVHRRRHRHVPRDERARAPRGALVFAAMLMYLQTRQRSEIVSYGLSLRMGMRSSLHLLAIATEVGAMLVVAYVAGGVLALAAAPAHDPAAGPDRGDPARTDRRGAGGRRRDRGAGLLLVAFAGGWLTERRARAADLGQVMRLAD